MVQPTLSTERLSLRPLSASDAGDISRLAGDPGVAEMTLNIPHPYHQGMAEEWIDFSVKSYGEGKSVVFAIEESSSGSFVGAVSLEIDEGEGELGYWIGRPFWGRGYCTEAGLVVLKFAGETLGLSRVFAEHLVSNPASGRVMSKLGMTHQKSFVAPHRDGQQAESDMYEIRLNGG